MYSLIVTAKMNDIDPQAWLADVLARIAEHPAHRLDELLPWNWRPATGDQPGSLTMAGIPHVFTISHVAEMLGEDEEWLREISINMDPEEGSLWVIGVGEDGCPAFTEYGIECLKQIIIEERRSASPRRAWSLCSRPSSA